MNWKMIVHKTDGTSEEVVPPVEQRDAAEYMRRCFYAAKGSYFTFKGFTVSRDLWLEAWQSQRPEFGASEPTTYRGLPVTLI